MHASIVHFAPVLAAEKSKVPFYIAGGLLVAWALIVSMAVGMRNPSFPSTVGAQRAVMASTAVLVLAAVGMAVVTSGGSTSKATAAPIAQEGHEVGSPTSSSGSSTSSSGAIGGSGSGPSGTSGSGPSGTSGSGASTTPLKEEANPEGQLQFIAANLSAKAGKVTIRFANLSSLPHNLTIVQGTKVLGATPTFQGGARTVTLRLKPGTYSFYCSVPGHRQAGMEGKLTVQ